MTFKSNRILIVILLFLATTISFSQESNLPNVILIITDDQGYGDFGFTGNDQIKTPVLDALSKRSIRFNNFYVSPVCAPTRSSLMTGRYSLRTGVRDTYNGGAIMASNEVTIAEMLKQANYKTGMYGKWHLGDNYPSRPIDQGFDESLIHLSGGMGQVGDFTTYFQGDRSYFDPVLWYNGQPRMYDGYCSDIFTDNAINFIEKNHKAPFFCYLSFNAPHTPLQVPDEYYQMYADIDPSITFEKNKSSKVKMNEKDKEDARKVYAMVSNIDDNIGKVISKVKSLGIEDNTIIIFMTDNGPQQLRYVGGMRGLKGSVYRGGIRVPLLFSYPNQFKGNKDIETTTAHIDILPTIAKLCRVEAPKNKKIDGNSLLPLIKNEKVDWAERSLFFYWTRRYPELYNNIAIQKGDYKLVGKTNYNAPIEDFQMFDIKNDPNEQNNIVLKNKNFAKGLKQNLNQIYKELISSNNLINQPSISVGSEFENPIILNRNDAGGERGIWNQEEIFGKWYVDVAEGHYNIKFKFIKPVEPKGRMILETDAIVNQLKIDMETDFIEMKNIYLPKMTGNLIPFYMKNNKRILPFLVEIEKI
ncbi:arylsulfatase [Jejuia spongiicola]|uniref:Arylsulfatase n=1 Tax=Jejuia spongiicola TaxID=2942207 RepID=A0ABT0QFB0_9FLAO|nr:arylsulfatase [Jejuia spongiicola]MCL6295133.1 arylsulfatase [Jejuia spongiicola]